MYNYVQGLDLSFSIILANEDVLLNGFSTGNLTFKMYFLTLLSAGVGLEVGLVLQETVNT